MTNSIADRWRYECPYGHTTIHRVGGTQHRPDVDKQWKCDTCENQGREYHHSFVVDKKTGRKVGVG